MKDYRLDAKHKPIVFSFLLSCTMSLIVSAIATFQVLGISADFLQSWMKAWLSSWVVAYPVVMLVAPVVEGLLPLLVKKPQSLAAISKK